MLEMLVECFSVLLGGYSINNKILPNIECPKKRSTVSQKMSTCPKKEPHIWIQHNKTNKF